MSNADRLIRIALPIVLVLVFVSADMARAASIGSPGQNWEHTYANGMTLLEQKRYSEAEKSFLQALSRCSESVPRTLATLERLEEIYDYTDNYKAQELVLLIHLKILLERGAKAVYVASVCSMLGEAYTVMERYPDAEKYYELALPEMKSYLGNTSVQVGLALNNLAFAELEQKKYTEAELHFQQSLHALEKSVGESSLMYALTANSMAEFYEKMGRRETATMWYSKALTVFRIMLGEKHPLTMSVEDKIELLKQYKPNINTPSRPPQPTPPRKPIKNLPPDLAAIQKQVC